MAQLCLRNWTISYSAWHKSTDIHIPLGDPKSIVMLKHNLKYNFLILWKTPTLFSRHYITIFLLFFYLVATNSICLAVDSLCILYTQPSYPTPHIIICYIISWSRVNFRLTYFWSIGSWCDGSDGACIGQFCAPEGETFLVHLEGSISNLSFLFCAQNVAKIEGLSVEYWTSLWAGLSQIYLHFKLKMASLWQVVMFEPVPSQECSLSMLWLVPTHISGGAFINWYQSEHLCTNMCVPALILWSKTLHLTCGQSQRANILTQMLHWIFFFTWWEWSSEIFCAKIMFRMKNEMDEMDKSINSKSLNISSILRFLNILIFETHGSILNCFLQVNLILFPLEKKVIIKVQGVLLNQSLIQFCGFVLIWFLILY